MAICCEGLGKGMVGAWSLGGAGLAKQWELEEAAEQGAEEARMDNWAFRDKDDY